MRRELRAVPEHRPLSMMKPKALRMWRLPAVDPGWEPGTGERPTSRLGRLLRQEEPSVVDPQHDDGFPCSDGRWMRSYCVCGAVSVTVGLLDQKGL